MQHWGLVVTSYSALTPSIYHAVNNETTNDVWALVTLHSSDAETLLRNPLMLLLRKIGAMDLDVFDEEGDTMGNFSRFLSESVKVGQGTEIEGEVFSCKTWVRDTLGALFTSRALIPGLMWEMLEGECVAAAVEVEKISGQKKRMLLVLQ
jgi:hypothetical protein